MPNVSLARSLRKLRAGAGGGGGNRPSEAIGASELEAQALLRAELEEGVGLVRGGGGAMDAERFLLQPRSRKRNRYPK